MGRQGGKKSAMHSSVMKPDQGAEAVSQDSRTFDKHFSFLSSVEQQTVTDKDGLTLDARIDRDRAQWISDGGKRLGNSYWTKLAQDIRAIPTSFTPR